MAKEKLHRTNLKTYMYGRWYKVLQDEKTGNLYFRYSGQLHGTFREYCIEA